MRLRAYISDKGSEREVAAALASGADNLGDEVIVHATEHFEKEGVQNDTDVAIVIGLKGHTKTIMSAHLRAAKHVLFIDKGYFSRKTHMRVSLDATHPIHYVGKLQEWAPTKDRLTPLRIPEVKPMRSPDREDHILFAGQSQKYCNFYGLGDATEFSSSKINNIRKTVGRPIWYRPKPSWHAGHPEETPPIEGTRFSVNEPIKNALRSAFALVTHGSGAVIDAIHAGVPSIVLSDSSIFRLLFKHETSDLRHGELSALLTGMSYPSVKACTNFLAELAQHQFSLDEIRDGVMWRTLRPLTRQASLLVSGQSEELKNDLLSVIDQYREMHKSEKMFRGKGTGKHLVRIGRLVLKTDAKTILDYGCGKGLQYSSMKIHEAWDVPMPTMYDPAVPGIDQKPIGVFDGVICNDMLEHVPEDFIDETLATLFAHARKFLFLSICTVPATKRLPDGRNCHLTVKPKEWWDRTLDEHIRAYPDLLLDVEYNLDGGRTESSNSKGSVKEFGDD